MEDCGGSPPDGDTYNLGAFANPSDTGEPLSTTHTLHWEVEELLPRSLANLEMVGDTPTICITTTTRPVNMLYTT